MNNLSVVIIAYNEERIIRRCLDSLKDIANEIIVVDSESTDSTAEICRESGCRVIQRKFDGYSLQKQFGVDQAKNDWILSIDADEYVSKELRQEILSLLTIEQIPHSAYLIPFRLCYSGKILRFTRISPNLRLFNRKKGKFNNNIVHERVDITGSIGTLKGKMIHYSYRDLSHHISKINTYTSQAAEGNVMKGRSYSGWWVAFKFPVNFFIFYIIRRGIFDGYPGFLWAFFAAVSGSVKIAKTIEKQSHS